MFKRQEYQILTDRLREPRRFMQVVLGPRQVGKSTMINQVLSDLETPHLIYSADAIPRNHTSWISDCWNTARRLLNIEKTHEYIFSRLIR